MLSRPSAVREEMPLRFSLSWRNFLILRFMDELKFQRFLMALSVRPGST
jgi:hypothetical protein